MGDPLGPDAHAIAVQQCRRCGLPADLLGPDGLCGPCRAATIADERLALLRALGMPPEAPLSLYERTEDFREPTTPVPLGQAWMKGADWEFLGLCVPAPPTCPGPVLRDPAHRGQFLVQLWRVRVYHQRSALWWEMLWNPRDGHHIDLHGGERVARQAEWAPPRRTLPHLQRMATRPGPEPVTGHGQEWDWSQVADRWRADVVTAIRGGYQPSLAILAAHLGISKSKLSREYLTTAERKAELRAIALEVQRPDPRRPAT